MMFRLVIFFFSLTLSFSAFADFSWDLTPPQWKIDTLQSAYDLSLFWWNIDCSQTALESERKKITPENSLANNITALLNMDNTPSLFLLGEHCPGQIPKSTKNLLQRKYPHSYELRKNNADGGVLNGIWVFSKWPLKEVAKKKMSTESTSAENSKTTRTYLLLKVLSPNGDFFLSPVHIYNPWREALKNIASWDIAGLINTLGGMDNVNYRQIEEHLRLLSQDVNLSTDKVIVLGDFNSAKNYILWNSMAGYNLYSQALLDVGVNEPTYPTPTSKKLDGGFPDIQIDHVFISPSFPQGQTVMLPLQGSDHFPIFFHYAL